MLTLNSKSRYGLLATLALAEHHGRGLMQIKDISRRHAIPVQYLAQIFSLLVKADLIRSVRGKNGGYRLSRNPASITVLEILEVLEGGISLTGPDDPADDAVHDLLVQAEQQLRKVFDISLADLLGRHLEKQHILMFNI